MFREREDLCFVLVWFFSCLFPFREEAGLGVREETEFGTDRSALQMRKFRKMQRPWELLLLISISFGYI